MLPNVLAVLALLLVSANPADAGVSFSGLVSDPQGRPIEGARVTLRTLGASSLRFKTQTNSEGRYRFELFDAAKGYWFVVSKEGYLSVGSRFASGLERLVLDPKFEKSFTLHPIGSISLPDEEPLILVVQQSTGSRSYTKGLRAFESGKWEVAGKHFEEALEHSRDEQIRQAAEDALAMVYYRLRDHVAAARASEAVLERNPGNAVFLRIQYEASRGLGDEDDARSALMALVEADPGEGTARLFHNEGVTAARRGDLELAQAMFEAALRLVPEMIQAQDNLAKIYIQRREYAGAAAAAEMVFSTNPSNLDALRILYEACHALHDREGALEALEELVVRDPGRRTATLLYNEGVLAFSADDTETAEHIFHRALGLDPTHVDASIGLAEVYIQQHKFREALEMTRKLLEKHPEHSAALRIEKRALRWLEDR